MMQKELPALPVNFEEAMSTLVGAPELPDSSKSPLRYPGGKFRAVDTIKSYIPEGTKELVSPFLGGGSLELSCAFDGMTVHGADAFKPLVNFWEQTLRNPVLLSERVRQYHPLTKRKFYSLQKGFDKLKDEVDQAAVFYVLNRSSFSGTTLSGGMSPGHPRFTESAINRLRDFRSRNLNVSYADYKDTIEDNPGKLLYLDPPYDNGEKLYGDRGNMHWGFSHDDLADMLKSRDGWILSYNDCESIRSLYSDFEILEPEWQYGMSGDKRSKEVLVINL